MSWHADVAVLQLSEERRVPAVHMSGPLTILYLPEDPTRATVLPAGTSRLKPLEMHKQKI
jgi:hypothetical protein